MSTRGLMRAWSVGLLSLLIVGASGPVDGPSPPPGAKVQVLYVTFPDGSQQFRELKTPIASHQVPLELVRFGQEMQLAALATGDEAQRRKGLALTSAVLEDDTYTVGGVCPCVPLYACGCSPGCGGPGCAYVKVKAIR